MIHQFIPQSEASIWKEREDLLVKTRQNAVQLFGEKGWVENSVWELSKYFVVEMQKYSQSEKIVGEKHKSFFFALAGHVDYDLLENINKYLERLLAVVSVPAVEVAQLPPALAEEWEALGDYLDLTPAGAKKLWERVKGLPPSESASLMEKIRPLAGSYNDFRVVFMFVAAALVYFIPPTPLTDLDSFKYFLSVEAEKNDPSFNIESGLTALNFLGWSMVNENKDTMQWAVEYLTKQFELDNAVLSNSIDALLFVVILHLAFFHLADQPREAQEELAKKFIWNAICLGVPVEYILKDVLSKETVLSNQKKYLNNLMEILAGSEENVYLEPNKLPMTVGQFVKRFLTYSRGDYGGFTQVKFIDEILKEFSWPEGLRYYLFILLNLYFHLKTGDILLTKRSDSLRV